MSEAVAEGADLAYWSATRLVEALARREVSSRELLEVYLGRLERYNGAINAVVTVDAERAFAQAAAADEAIAGGRILGPLHGLPMTVKDTLETAGLRTTAGAPELTDHVPVRDADAVVRLREAGAVIFGKTNAPTYARDIQAHNPLFGVTNNPWDLSRTPGGSSGGSAAAVTAGLTGWDLGSDLAGSVRLPAHYCGVFGLRPSYGIIPNRGHVPRAPGSLSSSDMATLGVLGRSGADLDLGLDVLAGPVGEQAVGWQLRLPPPRASRLSDYRVGVWLNDPFCPVDASVHEVLTTAVDVLGAAGVRLDYQAHPVDLADSDRLFGQLLFGATSLAWGQEAFASACAVVDGLDPADDAEQARMLRGTTQRLRDWHIADERRQRMRAAWRSYFANHDVLLCPVAPTAAIPHAHEEADRRLIVNGESRSYWDQTVWSGLASLAYLPAAVVPVGITSEGLPVGIQIIGPYLHDRTVTDIAQRLGRLVHVGQPAL